MIEITLIGVIVFLLGFIAWRDWCNGRQVDDLTNKLMARDYREYSVFNQPKPKQEPKREMVNDDYPRDSVLGKNY